MTIKVASLFWPRDVKVEPGVINRLGCLLHWLFTVCAALWGLGMTASLLDFDRLIQDGDWGAVVVCGAFALITFAMGRGARYVFSGE